VEIQIMVCNFLAGIFLDNQSRIPSAPPKIVAPYEMIYTRFIINTKTFPDYSEERAKKLLKETTESDTLSKDLIRKLSDFNSSLWVEKLRSICHQFDEYSLTGQVEMRKMLCKTLLTPSLNVEDKNTLEEAIRALHNYDTYSLSERSKPPSPSTTDFFLELDKCIYDLVCKKSAVHDSMSSRREFG